MNDEDSILKLVPCLLTNNLGWRQIDFGRVVWTVIGSDLEPTHPR